LWGYPHPYFGNKILVFFNLQVWFHCKIVKTKELFAKYSRIRSYALIWPLLASFGCSGAGTIGEKHLRMIVHRARKILCKGSEIRGGPKQKSIIFAIYSLDF